MNTRICLSTLFASSVVFTGIATTTAASIKSDQQLNSTFASEVIPVLEQYCYGCHGEKKQKADLSFHRFRSLGDARNDPETWELILDMLAMNEMPPEDKDQPTLEQRELITHWIEESLFTFDSEKPDPGRVTISRLNRSEYNNSIRDLVGVSFRPADDFPLDDAGYGFDNIGDVLTLPSMLMEKYIAAAHKIMDQAIVTEAPQSATNRYPVNLLEVGFNALGDRGDGWVHLVSLEEDDVAVELPIPAPGDYKVRLMAYAEKEGGVQGYVEQSRTTLEEHMKGISQRPPMISFKLGDTFIDEFEVSTDPDNPGIYEARVGVTAGNQRFRAVVHRERGGDGELVMKNGRIGKQQQGIVFVKWMEIEGPLPGLTRRYNADTLSVTGKGEFLDDGTRLLSSAGEVSKAIRVEINSEFILRAYAYADQAGDEPTRMEFRIDGKPIKVFDVIAPATLKPLPGQRLFSAAWLDPMPQVYEFKYNLKRENKKISAAFINDFEDPENENLNLRDRNLYIQKLEIVDLEADWTPPPMPDIIAQYFDRKSTSRDETKAAKKILSGFSSNAWRRPVKPDELSRLMELYEMAKDYGDGFNARIKLAMKGILVSPNFLFRKESQPDPNDPTEVHYIDEYALASRLSYFLWSSIPDQELYSLAERGQLRKNLGKQVRRMLASPKARALVDNFAGQWLQTRRMVSVHPDRDLFKEFSQYLQEDMRNETELFFESIMKENRNVVDFLNADYTFLNERLARHYGISGVEGEPFRKVSLEGTPRRGVLTHGSILTLTSNPNRTSPVKRGKWVLDNLLGTPPLPPPPDVPELKEPGEELLGSLREQMKQHREDPSCASCHKRMDPIGFGLENFDAIGAWRDTDGGDVVDPSGELVSGETFNGAVELIDLLAETKKDEFLKALSEKMLIYALGRGLKYFDRPAVDGIVDELEDGDNSFESLIMGVVESAPFQMRRGDSEPELAGSTDYKDEGTLARNASQNEN
ncbi:MAG: hypothetical protein ACI92G_001735 [Candidatus Pelagisphaera sp.]|jgi:hypothetical protein